MKTSLNETLIERILGALVGTAILIWVLFWWLIGLFLTMLFWAAMAYGVYLVFHYFGVF
jgi:hypothetical protein